MALPTKVIQLLLWGLATNVFLADLTQARTCLILYQMADNDLEFYIKQDFEELAESSIVSSDDLRSWVYFDASNSGGEPPEVLYDEKGDLVTDIFPGSRYMTYDKTLSGMRVNKTLSGEQDSDSPEVLQQFLEHGMADCVAGGYTSFMVVFASHGGGFAGFGGDENKARRLVQSNQKITEAIRGALTNTPGAPAKLDVIGFDACSMQAIGAADEYMEVANYMLASEALEPGHGWAYYALTKADDALTLAQEVVNTFINEKHGSSSHRTPKTLSIIDTDLFRTFVAAFDNLFGLIMEAVESDETLHAYIGRARSSAVAFEGVMDAEGTENPSAMDIGSFLSELQLLCRPGGAIGTALTAAKEAYDAMIFLNGIGQGTAAGTGIYLDWPGQTDYSANAQMWDTILLKREMYVTAIVPSLVDFLEFFLTTSTPEPEVSVTAEGRTGGDSVCFSDAQPEGEPNVPDGLMYNSNMDVQNDTITVSTGIGISVSYVLFEYGLDLTTPLKRMLKEKGYEPSTDDTLQLFGGDVQGTYEGSQFSGTWNRDFYFLNISGVEIYEALYVLDQGDGSKNVPVIYFPEDRREDVGKLQFLDYLFFNFNYWTSVGAKFGFLKFSVDEETGEVDDNLILFTSIAKERGFKQEPRSSQGMMIPLVHVKGLIQGRKIDRLPGGFNQTIINWSDEIDYNVIAVKDDRIANVVPDTDAIMVTLKAYNFGESNFDPEVKSFDVVRVNQGSVSRGDEGGSEQETGEDLYLGGSSAAQLSFGSGLMVAAFLLHAFM